MDESRFETIYVDRDFVGKQYILKDRVTGASYLMTEISGTGTGVGLTPLLGPDGKPIVDPVE